MPADDSRTGEPGDLPADRREGAPAGDGRQETSAERMDRNWSELLSELRITQTGAQLLVGFLLTVPFQARFTSLDRFAQTLYLVLVGLAVLATLLLISPVVVHRVLFRRHRKAQLVRLGDRFARAGLAVLALVLAGAPLLLVDVVVSRTAGLLAGSAGLALVLTVWVGVPAWAARTPARPGDAPPSAPVG